MSDIGLKTPKATVKSRIKIPTTVKAKPKQNVSNTYVSTFDNDAFDTDFDI